MHLHELTVGFSRAKAARTEGRRKEVPMQYCPDGTLEEQVGFGPTGPVNKVVGIQSIAERPVFRNDKFPIPRTCKLFNFSL
jgi:hypothetical protein